MSTTLCHAKVLQRLAHTQLQVHHEEHNEYWEEDEKPNRGRFNACEFAIWIVIGTHKDDSLWGNKPPSPRNARKQSSNRPFGGKRFLIAVCH
jgi:hypothetical protein